MVRPITDTAGNSLATITASYKNRTILVKVFPNVKIKACAPRSPRSERAGSDDAFTSQRQLVSLGDLFSLSGFVAFLDRFLLADILAFLGLAIETRAFFMIHMRFSVDPHQAVPSTWGGCRFSDRLGSGCSSRGRSNGSGRAR